MHHFKPNSKPRAACAAGKWMLDGNASEVWRAPADADAWRGEPSVSSVYPANKPMSAPEMRDAVGAALRVLARDPAAREDPLPRDMVAKQQLMDWAQVKLVADGLVWVA
jgi:RecG-like helicase